MMLAVLGCGSIGQRHIRNLRALGEERVVAYDPDPARRSEASAAGAARVVDRVDAALDPRPQAVLVCSPPAAHLDGLRAAVAAGAHALVEKPIAHALDGVDAALRSADAAGCRVEVGYNLRHEAGLREARSLIAAGRIGRVLHMRAEFGQYLPDWRPSRDYRAGYNASAAMGGGVLIDQTHEIDYVRWIMGGEPVSVSAMLGKVSALEIDVEDVALVTMRFGDGRLAAVSVDSVRRDYVRRCTVVGTAGTLVWNLTNGLDLFDAEPRRWEHRDVGTDLNAMYLSEMQAFLALVRETGPATVTGWDALRTLAIADAAQRSARDGMAVGPSGTISP